MKKLILFFIAAFVIFTGCDKNPAGALIHSDVGQSTEWAPEWIIYDDEVKTRNPSAIAAYTSYWAHDNPGGLDLNYKNNPHSGAKCIRLYWDGSKNTAYGSPNYDTYGWCGFGFPSAAPNTGVWIPTGTYNSVKFWVKGSLSAFVVLEIKGPQGEVWTSPAGANYSNWTEITLPFAVCVNPEIGPVTNMLAVSIINTRNTIPSNGGEIFLDDIRYVK